MRDRPSSNAYIWYVVALLTVTQIVAYIDRFLPSLLLAPIKASMHLSDFQIGLLLGPAFALFYVTLSIPLGWLADHWPRRSILAVGVLVWCSMTAAASLVGSFIPLLATRLGLGIGEAAVGPCAISLVSDYFPANRRAAAFALLMSGVSLGAGSAFLFGGPLVHHIQSLPPVVLPLFGAREPWQMCFLVVGLPGLVLALLLFFTVREPPRRDLPTDVAGRPTALDPSLRGTLRYITGRWRAFGTLFAGSACNLTMGVLSTWNVALFQRSWGWDVRTVGLTTGLLFLTVGPLGVLGGLWLTKRVQRQGRPDATMRALLSGLLIAVPAYLLFPLMPDVRLAVLGLGIAYFGQSIATVAGPASLSLIAPGSIRAQATAIYYFVINIVAQVIGPPPVGLMADLLGDPHQLRYAISAEVLVVSIPGIILTMLGLKAYARCVTATEAGMLAAA